MPHPLPTTDPFLPADPDLSVQTTPPDSALVVSHERLVKRIEAVVCAVCALEDGGPLSKALLGELDDMTRDLANARRISK